MPVSEVILGRSYFIVCDLLKLVTFGKEMADDAAEVFVGVCFQALENGRSRSSALTQQQFPRAGRTPCRCALLLNPLRDKQRTWTNAR